MEELLKRGVKPESLWVALKRQPGKEEPLLVRCRAAGWKIEEHEKSVLDQLTEGLPHQNYLAFIREFSYTKLNDLITFASSRQNPIILALDQIQDVGNLGAIIRSAECAGAAGVIIPTHRSAGITAAAFRRSAGAALHIPVCRVMNLSKALDALTDAGFLIVGADQEGNRTLYQTKLDVPVTIVIGSEGRGLRPGVKRRCNILMNIPLQGRVASLNAAAAAAICLFETLRQQQFKSTSDLSA